METITTNGVKISVEVAYQPQVEGMFSTDNQYVFAYRIHIQNLNPYSVQLLHRHWYICNGLGEWRAVDGPGVVGKQPIIAPNGHYQYVSCCPIPTDMGKMHGTYTMRNVDGEGHFSVDVPEFLMILPEKMN